MRKIPPLATLGRICQKPDYKRVGNWMARNVTRDMALYLTWIFLHTPISANQVTFLSLVCGLLSGLAFTGISAWQPITGVLLWQFWYILDHVDGQIARYRQESSLTGVFFDFIHHYAVHAFIAFSIGVGAFRITANPLFIYAGFSLAGGLTLMRLIGDLTLATLSSRLSLPDPSKRGGALLPGGKLEAQKTRSILKSGFSFAWKLLDIHVLMNLFSVTVLVDWLLRKALEGGNFLLTPIALLFLGLLAPLLWIVKLAYYVKRKEVDQINSSASS